jgi:hypothetical protein
MWGVGGEIEMVYGLWYMGEGVEGDIARVGGLNG